MSYRSDHAGKRYDFTASHAQIMAIPDWTDGADKPPLSPRKAPDLARADMATFLPDPARWLYPQNKLQSVGGAHTCQGLFFSGGWG